jgi:hypothetical protein
MLYVYRPLLYPTLEEALIRTEKHYDYWESDVSKILVPAENSKKLLIRFWILLSNI